MKSPLSIFEKIKHQNNQEKEYWTAREMATVLEYTDFRNFVFVVKKAKISCENAGQSIKNHFVDVNEMVRIGSKASREVLDN